VNKIESEAVKVAFEEGELVIYSGNRKI